MYKISSMRKTEHLRTLLVVNATLLDRSNQQELDKFNELLQDYFNAMYPGAKKESKKAYEEKAKLLDDFKTTFKTKGKLKNFIKVKDGGNNRLQS